MLLVLALVLVFGRTEVFPAHMPIMRCSFESCSSITGMYVSLLQRFSHQLDEFVTYLKTDFFSPEFYHSISTQLETSNNNYAILFEQVIPSASRVDYFVYTAFINVVTDAMVSMCSGSVGTDMGFSFTVKDTVDSADFIHRFLRSTARHIVSPSFDGIMIPGIPGFFIARQTSYGYTVTTLHDSNSGIPGSFSSDIILHTIVKELALGLGNGDTLPQTSLAEYVFSRSIELPSIFITNAYYTYRYPFMIAFVGPSRYEGKIVFSNGTTHRLLTPAGDNWHLIQTSQPYNATHPFSSDFRITQLEKAQLDSISKDEDNFQEFYNTLRVYPFRTSLTPFLAAFSGNGLKSIALLQSCIPIKDASKQIVACADPPPATNWVAVIFSLIIIGIVIFLWVYGIKSASYLNKLEEYRAKHPEKVVLDPYEQRQVDRKRAREELEKKLNNFVEAECVHNRSP